MNRIKSKILFIVSILGILLVNPTKGIGETPAVNFLLEWGQHGTARGEFNQPIGISVDSEGNVYVSDSGNDRIQKFSNNGKFILSWGKEGSKK